MRRLGLLCLGALLAFPAVARGDAVIDWNGYAQTAIFSTGPTAHASTLSFAMVHGAVYDAVNAIDRSHRPYLHVAPERRPASAHREASVRADWSRAYR